MHDDSKWQLLCCRIRTGCWYTTISDLYLSDIVLYRRSLQTTRIIITIIIISQSQQNKSSESCEFNSFIFSFDWRTAWRIEFAIMEPKTTLHYFWKNTKFVKSMAISLWNFGENHKLYYSTKMFRATVNIFKKHGIFSGFRG